MIWRRRALHGLAFVLLLLGVDRLAYIAAFPQFDRVLHLTKLEKAHEILIVGSSHVLWDLDHKWAANQSGRKIEMVSVPGANMDLRRHLVQDYLKHQGDSAGPFVIVMEADKYSFDSKRYPEAAPNAMLGYYHHGILREFLWGRLDQNQRILNSLLHVRSLNQPFVFIGARVYDRAGEILSNLFGPLLRLLPGDSDPAAVPQLPPWMQAAANETAQPGTQQSETAQAAPPTDSAEDPRLAKWREQYAEYDVRVDPEPARAFQELIEFVQADPRVRLILLDTPNFLLFPGREERFNREVRAVLQEPTSHERIEYWRFDRAVFELDPTIFADASHLNVPGRIAFTQEFTRRVKEMYAISQ
ncbi:MAG: hypothetical protein NXI24_14285 [bacterium]|nr:hypothetical protein [bacterium]